jgi:hypothetical protein
LAILIVSVLKDLYDEYRLQRGGQPLAYANIEHSPSNAVLIVFILTGMIAPVGHISVSPQPLGRWHSLSVICCSTFHRTREREMLPSLSTV